MTDYVQRWTDITGNLMLAICVASIPFVIYAGMVLYKNRSKLYFQKRGISFIAIEYILMASFTTFIIPLWICCYYLDYFPTKEFKVVSVDTTFPLLYATLFGSVNVIVARIVYYYIQITRMNKAHIQINRQQSSRHNLSLELLNIPSNDSPGSGNNINNIGLGGRTPSAEPIASVVSSQVTIEENAEIAMFEPQNSNDGLNYRSPSVDPFEMYNNKFDIPNKDGKDNIDAANINLKDVTKTSNFCGKMSKLLCSICKCVKNCSHFANIPFVSVFLGSKLKLCIFIVCLWFFEVFLICFVTKNFIIIILLLFVSNANV